MTAHKYRFDDYVFDASRCELTRKGFDVRLQDQPARLLRCLLENAGQVVTRQEIQKTLWPENTNVEFDQSLRVAVSKVREALRDDAERPSYIETIPRQGYRFIGNLTLESVPEVVQAPSAPARTNTQPVTPHTRWNWRWVTAAGVFASILLLGIFLAFFRNSTIKPIENIDAQPVVRHSVAVLGLRNLTGAQQDLWLSTGLSEMLSTELASNDGLRTVTNDEIARAGLSNVGSAANFPSHEALDEAAKRLGVDMIVYGSYSIAQRQTGKDALIRVDLHLVNFSTDAPTLALARAGHTSDLFALVSDAGAELRQRLGLEALNQDGVKSLHAVLPSNATAAQFYAEGIFKSNNYDALGARELLMKAEHIEPSHAGTHLALSRVWLALGYEKSAQQEADLAVTNSQGLPRAQSLEIEGQQAFTSHNWKRAIDIYRSLTTFYPDELGYTLRLVDALNGASRSDEALKLLNALPQRSLSSAALARLLFAQVVVQQELGNYQQALDAVNQTEQLAAKLNLDQLRARALSRKATILERLGRIHEAIPVSLEAQRIFHSVGDNFSAAVAQLAIGDVYYDTDKLNDARTNFEGALAVFRHAGYERSIAVTVERIGNVYFSQGQTAEAIKYYNQSLDSYRKIGFDAGVASALGNIANTQDTAGDVVGSIAANTQVATLFENASDQRGEAATLDNIGNAEMERGNIDDAEKFYQKSLAINQKINYTQGIYFSKLGLGDVLAARNKLADAVKIYQDDLKDLTDKDELTVRDNTLLSLGNAEYHQGNFKAAVRDLQRVSEDAIKSVDHPSAALALAALSWAQASDGNPSSALASARHCQTEAQAQFGVQTRLIATFAMAHALAVNNQSQAANALLKEALHAAEAHNYTPMALEMRIELARIAGNKAQLKSLENEATSHGWLLIAAEAQTNNK